MNGSDWMLNSPPEGYRRPRWAPPRRRRPRVGLIGFYGWGNYGDELFLQLWRRRLSPCFEVSTVHELLMPPYVIGDPARVAEGYDAFLIGGGDLVIPSGVSQLYWRREWLARRVYISGVGVPQWRQREDPDAVAHMSAFFRHPNVQYISARDEQSAQWIRDRLRPHVPVLVHPDLVFGMDLPAPRPDPDGPPTLGVSVRQGLYHRDNDYAQLSRLVDRARADGYAISVLYLAAGRQRRRDAPAVEQLPFTPDEVVSAQEPDAISAAIGGMDAFASMKFHGLVVALMYGVPALALTPNSKNVSLLCAVDRPDLIGDLAGEIDLALKLPRLRVPVDRELVAGLVHEARVAGDALVRQMRIQLDPLGLLPTDLDGAGAFVGRVLPDVVRLGRRARAAERERRQEAGTAPAGPTAGPAGGGDDEAGPPGTNAGPTGPVVRKSAGTIANRPES